MLSFSTNEKPAHECESIKKQQLTEAVRIMKCEGGGRPSLSLGGMSEGVSTNAN